MAPERILGEPYTTPVEICSLGAIVVEMADGAPSFADKSSLTVMRSIASRRGPFLRKPEEVGWKSFEAIVWCACLIFSRICLFFASSAFRRDEGVHFVDVNLRTMGPEFGGNVNSPHIS